MKWNERIVSLFYRAATGSRMLRNLLTPLGTLFFILVLALIVFASLWLDRLLGLPALKLGRAGVLLGMLSLAAGFSLWLWTFIYFILAGGTPVPFNPPPRLLTGGPYARARNPMISGIFFLVLGTGLLLKSISMTFIMTPAFILASVLELKFVEEPELEMRLGREYREYRLRVPMFIPRIWRGREEKK